MCKIMEDLCKEVDREGQLKGQLNIMCELVKDGDFSLSSAVKKSGLPEDAFRTAMRECYPTWRE